MPQFGARQVTPLTLSHVFNWCEHQYCGVGVCLLDREESYSDSNQEQPRTSFLRLFFPVMFCPVGLRIIQSGIGGRDLEVANKEGYTQVNVYSTIDQYIPLPRSWSEGWVSSRHWRAGSYPAFIWL